MGRRPCFCVDGAWERARQARRYHALVANMRRIWAPPSGALLRSTSQVHRSGAPPRALRCTPWVHSTGVLLKCTAESANLALSAPRLTYFSSSALGVGCT